MLRARRFKTIWKQQEGCPGLDSGSIKLKLPVLMSTYASFSQQTEDLKGSQRDRLFCNLDVLALSSVSNVRIYRGKQALMCHVLLFFSEAQTTLSCCWVKTLDFCFLGFNTCNLFIEMSYF